MASAPDLPANAAPTAGELIRRIAPILGVRPMSIDGSPNPMPVLPQDRKDDLRYALVGDEDEASVAADLPQSDTEVTNAAY